MTFPTADDKGSSGRVVKVELKNFLSSSEAEGIQKKHKDCLETVLRRFLESVYIYHDTAPMELETDQFREVVLETLPRYFSGEEDYLSSVPAVVEAYVQYLRERESVKDPKGFEKVLGEMRKKFTRAAKKVKPDDRIYADGERQPLKKDEGKVGRNDPCPCGSGKKFKKCCQLKTGG